MKKNPCRSPIKPAHLTALATALATAFAVQAQTAPPIDPAATLQSVTVTG